MKFVRAFGQFWYDFLIGDDWKIAVGVVSTLALGMMVLLAVSPNDKVFTSFMGLALMGAFAVALRSPPERSHDQLPAQGAAHQRNEEAGGH
jgi:hypothetical protein